MSKEAMGLWARWAMVTPWIYGALALFMAVVSGAVAVAMVFWPAGVVSLLLLGVAVWNFSTGRRIRQAWAEGKSPVSVLMGGSGRGAGFVAIAQQNDARRARQGVVAIVDGVAAFVPQSDWSGHFVNTLAMVSSVGISKVVMLPIPQSLAQLHALVEMHQGFYLDRAWVWSIPGRMLTSPEDPSVVSVKLGEPHIGLWKSIPNAADVKRKTLMVMVGLATVFLVGGVVAWLLTQNNEFLQSGVFCFVLTIIVSVVALRRLPV